MNTSKPDIHELGLDLLKTTDWQRRRSLARPYIGLALYIVLVYFKLWSLTPIIVFLIFIAVVTVTHDVVHGSIGLNSKQTDWALFFMGAILFESGHAYKISHLHHHKRFPNHDDPEGEPARMSKIKALLCGVTFLYKLYFWALANSKKGSADYKWMIVEGIWFVFWVVISIVLIPYSYAVAWYVLMAIVGSWVYPFLTAHLPHYDYGESPLQQTRSLRGKIIPALFLELTYHLEHHLYPMVPSHNLKKLSNRIDPFLKKNGAKIWNVI